MKPEKPDYKDQRRPLSVLEIIFEGIALAALLITIWFPIDAWPQLAENRESPGAFGGRGVLLFLPILNSFLYIAFGLAARLYPFSRTLIRGFKALMLLFFAFLEWTAVQLAMGSEGLPESFFPILLLLLALIVGLSLLVGLRAR